MLINDSNDSIFSIWDMKLSVEHFYCFAFGQTVILGFLQILLSYSEI